MRQPVDTNVLAELEEIRDRILNVNTSDTTVQYSITAHSQKTYTDVSQKLNHSMDVPHYRKKNAHKQQYQKKVNLNTAAFPLHNGILLYQKNLHTFVIKYFYFNIVFNYNVTITRHH